MGFLKFEIEENFNLKINTLRNGMQEIGPRVIRETTDFMETHLKIITPVRTGKLKASIRSVIYNLTGEVSTNSGYGKYVDQDTAPHIIKGNPFLRVPLEGKILYLRQVFHPGTTGQNLSGRTLKAAKENVKDVIARAYLDLVQR